MSDIIRIGADSRSSRVVIFNGIVNVTGLTAKDRSKNIQDQTREVLSLIDDYLAQAGTDKSRLLTAQIWLKDIARDFKLMNEVWNEWTAPGSAPTRATAQCEMAAPDILIEIIVTAALPG